jgi:acetyl-CoA carboxylase biotin carboxyl carrier protein
MKFEQIKELIKLLQETNISEFKYESSELNMSIRTKDFHKVKEVMVQPTMMQAQPFVSANPVTQTNTNPVVVNEQTASAVVEKQTTKSEDQTPKSDANVKYIEIKSPMVGTFYRSSSPEKPAFAKVGDVINPDSTVCLIEAMKLFNDVKAEVSGKIVKVMVEDASPVEYEQVLFLVEPA